MPVEPQQEDVMSDDGDLACSQALENLEELLTSQSEQKIPKVDVQPLKRPQNRLTLNLNRFSFIAPKKPPAVDSSSAPSTSTLNSNENRPTEPNNTDQAAVKPKRNRILCTPSDDESSQNDGTQEEPAKKLPFKSNLFSLKSDHRLILQQQNANEIPKNSENAPENDSAYDTMELSSTPSFMQLGSAAKTGITPPIFGPSSGTTGIYAHQDLSHLDLEF